MLAKLRAFVVFVGVLALPLLSAVVTLHHDHAEHSKLARYGAEYHHAHAESRSEIDSHFSPHGGCTEEVVRQIAAAKYHIRVLAYSFTSHPIRDALIAAQLRGVSVGCIVDAKSAAEKGCVLPDLAKAGIACFTDAKHKIAHQKVMVLDEKIVLCGSFNWSKSAEASNSEILLTIHDTTLANKCLENWGFHLSHSQSFGKKQAAGRLPRRKIGEANSRALSGKKRGPLSEETRRKIGEANRLAQTGKKRRPLSAETKQKIGAAYRRRIALKSDAEITLF